MKYDTIHFNMLTIITIYTKLLSTWVKSQIVEKHHTPKYLLCKTIIIR